MSGKALGSSGIRALTDLYYDLQKTRIALGNRLDAIQSGNSYGTENEAKVLASLLARVSSMEKEISEAFKEYVRSSPVWPWLHSVRGIGDILAANLIATYGDCSRFDTISKMWAYTGLHVIKRCQVCGKRYFDKEIEKERFVEKMVKRLEQMAERRKKGEEFDGEAAEKRVRSWICTCENPKPYSCAPSLRRDEVPDWNQRARVLAFKIADSFVKHECFGRKLYQDFLAEERSKGKPKGKAYMTARRKAVKIFLANYWLNARAITGQPTRPPYAHGRLGHTDMIRWPVEKEEK